MTPAACIALVLLVVCAAMLYALVWALDRAAAAELRAATLDAQLTEALMYHGAEIARSKRMALRVVERVQ